MVSPAKSKLLPEVFWDTLSQEQEKKKVLWDLRQDVDGLRHPLQELSSRKTPPSSHTALEVPASMRFHGAQTRASPTPRRATRCEQAWAQGQTPAYRLSNLPGTRKYELGQFCPQASVLWTKLNISAGCLSPLPAQVPFTPLGLFSHFIGKTECLTWNQSREGMAQLPSSLEYSRIRVFCWLERLLPATFGTKVLVLVHLHP